MPYNIVADSFRIKKLCSRLSSSKENGLKTENWTLKTAVLRFQETYDNHIRLIGKRVVDFLLVLIKVFFARCYGWGATGKNSWKIDDFAPMGPIDPKFQVEGVAPTNHSSSQNTRLSDLSYGIKIWTDLSSVLSQSTRLADGQTYRQNSHRLTASAFHAAL